MKVTKRFFQPADYFDKRNTAGLKPNAEIQERISKDHVDRYPLDKDCNDKINIKYYSKKLRI